MATHIRAGEIIARQVSGNEYVFTFIGYRDVEGILFQNGIFDFGDGTTFGGDNADEMIPWVRFAPEDGVERWEFTLPHTYPAAANYIVSYTEENRNEDIQNIPGSVNTAFHVETLVIIDALFPNSSPFFTVPPIDQGVVGAIFEHNPGAFDPDDDSLSYSLVTPQQANRLDVGGYLQLNDAGFYEDFGTGNSTGSGPPEVFIDPVTGTLTWDAPGGATIPDMQNREWNVAIRVQEWRKIGEQFIPLGYVVRDMQIIIWDFENEPPELEVPEDTCVIAGEIITGIAAATDPDGDLVKVEAFGGPFQFPPKATFSPDPAVFQATPASVAFEWQTVCGFVRESPYQVEFKATDKPTVPGFSNSPGQSNFETWRITIVGPAPQGLTVDAISGSMELSWDTYECSNAQSMEIWRRVGEFGIDPNCNAGIPANSGYELIQTQDISDINFVDDNNGIGLAPGSKYCYRLVATFPQPLGGLSISSEEVCEILLIDLPVITNVDIVSTDEANGRIRVNWTPPYEIDAIAFPPNYTYEILRAEGQGPGGDFTSLATTGDTTFLDSGIDTERLAYSYRITLRDGLNNLVGTSQQASSVRLNPNPQFESIRLSWEANVPWSNTLQNFPYHYIYRDNFLTNFIDSLALIDSVDVTLNGFSYLDDGVGDEEKLDQNIEYCYSIATQGSYDNKLLPEPLLNRSQIICTRPDDRTPPCVPASVSFTSDSNFDCEAQFVCESNVVSLENVIEWNADGASECDDDIQFYRVYFSESTDSTTFQILEETTSLGFTHRNLTSLAFCYYVTAVDRSGNESQISEIICNDNCPQYILPNVFTPNNDGFNDTFRPLESNDQCPRFVDSVVLTVVNRAGREVFSIDTNDPETTIDVEWDGRTNRGSASPAGVYYYSAEVTFKVLNSQESMQVIKGWVQLIR
ncbi:MAG: gliding motility-associated C-terminal domain-containing protein [Ekhidna sp.]|nr:gliding motility-associated C-terminal domain-containing protein [Ekhidna sp.]